MGETLSKKETISTIAVESILLVIEILSILVSIAFKDYLVVWICLDLVLLSPLKAGVAFYYGQRLIDSNDSKVRYVFRFFRHGWYRTVFWRIGLWARYIWYLCLFSLPAIFLDVFRASATIAELSFENKILNITLLLSSYILWVGGSVICWIFCARYQIAVYLLPYHKQPKTLFADAKKRYRSDLLNQNVRLLCHLPLFCFILPYFHILPQFRAAQAVAAARQNVTDSQKQPISLLARLKKLW